VSGERVAREVKRAPAHLLHERGVRVDHSVGREHAVYLAHHSLRVRYVLKHRLTDGPVECSVAKRQVIPVTHDARAGADVDVGFDEVEARILDELLQANADNTSADDKDLRAPIERPDACLEASEVSGDSHIPGVARYQGVNAAAQARELGPDTRSPCAVSRSARNSLGIEEWVVRA
jgi:hypothetical protein